MRKYKFDSESRSLLNMFRSDKRIRVIKAYRTKDVHKLNKAVGRYHKAEFINNSLQISQKHY